MIEETNLILSPTYWQEQIEEVGQLLEERSNQLVDAETELAERLAAINAFEFKLRTAVGPLANRLDTIDQEIKAHRQKIRALGDEWGDFEGPKHGRNMADARDVFNDGGAAAAGDYRYMGERPPVAPHTLDADESGELKQLYRQLARRFHPDMSVDEADMAYRTQMMMAINAAYAARDLAQLRQLSLEPDAASRYDHARSDEQRVEILRQELARVERRLQEIRQELAKLEQHKSSRLMKRAQQAEADGRDFFADLAAQMKGEIARKMVERDVLKTEIETVLSEEGDLADGEVADNVWLWSLDNAYEEDPLPEMERWLDKRRGRYNWDEDDILDDSE
jgi:DNA repair exonuclease SbcCD ATPase subunit